MRAKMRLVAVVPVLILAVGCSTTTSGSAAAPSELSSAASASSSASSGPPSRSVRQQPTAATVTTTVTATPSGGTPAPPPTAAPSTSTPVHPPTDLTGEVWGFVTAVDVGASQITLDKIDWFTGAAAQQACAEDGVTSTDNNRCTGYYYRNVNPALRVVAVSPQASITTLDGARSTPGDLATVASRVSAGSPYRMVVSDGVVTVLEEKYLP